MGMLNIEQGFLNVDMRGSFQRASASTFPTAGYL